MLLAAVSIQWIAMATRTLLAALLACSVSLWGFATSNPNSTFTDRVFRLGTNFTLNCIDNGNNGNHASSISFIVDNHILGSNTVIDNQLRSRGIDWTITNNGTSLVGELSIPASVENNGTVVRCAAGSVFKPKQRIIVVEGPPGPPVAPSVTVTNLTALTLTWTAPWPHPVTNYTVTMLNLTSSQITHRTTCDEQLVLRGGGGQCDELVFTVEAETDVGSTGPSTNTTGGFPKGFDVIARNQSNVNITCERNTNILHAVIRVPEVCPYEAEIVVTLEVTDVLDGGTIVHGPTNQLMFDVSSTSNVTLSCDSTYNVELVVEDQVSDKITIQEMYNQHSPVEISTSVSEYSSTVAILTSHYSLSATPASTSATQSTTLPSPSPTVDTTMMIIIIGGAAGGGALVLLLLIVIACCGCVLCCRSRRQSVSITVDSNGTNGVGVTNGGLNPNKFSDNPIYQTSEDINAAYETIPYPLELRSLPPPLPTRNMVTPSTPSTSPRLSTDERENVSSEKVQFTMNLDHQMHSAGGPEMDQYITMATPTPRSMSPRYTEGPVFQFPPHLEPLPEETRIATNRAAKVNNLSLPSTPLPYL